MAYGKIIKIKDNVFNGFHPNGIDVNYSRVGFIFGPPTVGLRFSIGSLSTSIVKEVEEVNEYFTKITTENSLYYLFKGEGDAEVMFVYYVFDLLNRKEGVKPLAQLVSLDVASDIFKTFGFEVAPDDVDYNGWQLDFWMTAEHSQEDLRLQYSGTLWYMNNGKLSVE